LLVLPSESLENSLFLFLPPNKALSPFFLLIEFGSSSQFQPGWKLFFGFSLLLNHHLTRCHTKKKKNKKNKEEQPKQRPHVARTKPNLPSPLSSRMSKGSFPPCSRACFSSPFSFFSFLVLRF
jgi:hypothetical protein